MGEKHSLVVTKNPKYLYKEKGYICMWRGKKIICQEKSGKD